MRPSGVYDGLRLTPSVVSWARSDPSRSTRQMLTPPSAVLLAIVAISYRQTIHAYPSGGGAYIVAKENLGQTPGLVAAAALLVDYVLTVSVSIAAVQAIAAFGPISAVVAPRAKPATCHTGASRVGRTPRAIIIA